jgi:penicillin-binding protein 2
VGDADGAGRPRLRDAMTAPVQGPENSRVRLSIIGVVVFSLFAALFARVWYLQVMDSQTLATKVIHNATRTVYEPAPRGRILDRNGKVLVDNTYSLVVTLTRVAAQKDPDLVKRLAVLLDKPVDDLYKRIDDPRYSPYRDVPLVDNVPVDKVIYIKEHTEDFPPDAVKADREAQRVYPNDTLAAHILGYVGEINDDELKAHKDDGYAPGDEIGKSGVEQAYEKELRGTPGRTVVEVDPRGTVLGTLEHEDPVQGNDLYLTIDIDVQRVTEESLQQGLQVAQSTFDKTGNGKHFVAPAGSAVVLDPRDGSVLAMASYPTYSPSQFVGGISSANFAALQDPANLSPLNNRAIAGQYAPGSTFKLATATAALSKGIITQYSTFPDDGTFTIPSCIGQCTFHNALGEVYGRVPMSRALTVSSDVYFYNLGYEFYRQRSKYGDTAIQDVAHLLGLGVKTGIPLAGEAVGRVSDPKTREKLHEKAPKAFPNGQWFAGDNVNLAIGQGETVVTPLQLATAYATFGNGGTLYQPKLALKVADHRGATVEEFPAQDAGHVDLPPAVRDPILAGLKGVISDPRGTANAAFSTFPNSQFPVAGKTGTAEVNGKQDTALFAAFAPADNPQYAVSIVMEESGFGGTSAAPVARRIFEQLSGHSPTPIVFGTGQD